MMRFVVVRLIGAFTTLLLAVTLAFFLSRLAGDPVRNILGELATRDQVESFRTKLGFDRPLIVQLGKYLGSLLRGDLGTSLRYGQSNVSVIQGRLGASLQLAVAALAIAVAVGVPLGLIAAKRAGTWIDRSLMTFSLVGQSVPAFWLAMLASQMFAVKLGWFPAGGSGSLSHLVLPAITLGSLPTARVARLTRSAAVDVLDQPFVLAAQSRGVGEQRVLVSHVMRNISLPVITIVGLQAGSLLSGAVTIEVVFGWPGMGSLAVQAVQFRDFPLVQAIVIVGAVIFVVVNLLVDLFCGMADPRVRLTGD